MRANHTHGWGSKKKHRGAGNRGGRGNAGSGKRADSKKPSLWGDWPISGRFGFTSIYARKLKVINIEDVEDKLTQWHNEKKIENKGDAYTVDLEKLGYHKLLSRGKPSHKLHISVSSASAKAKDKIAAAGGSVEVAETLQTPPSQPGKKTSEAKQ